MTTFHTDDVCRKSSVYNQTGQNYFEQLSAYNHMSAHLRRILLARSVVDSRNKNYMRDKRLDCRSPIRSKSLDRMLTRKDIIDGLAYDTEHHPIDVLRMSLESNRECRKKKKRVSDDTCACYNVSRYVECRGASAKTARRVDTKPEAARSIRTRTNDSVSPIRYDNQRSSYESSRPRRLTGYKSGRETENDRSRRKNCVHDGNRTRSIHRSNCIAQVIDETYSYNSSFDSYSDTSDVDSSVDDKKFTSSSPRTSRVASTDRAGIKVNGRRRKLSDNVEPTDETKYAKFLYDITQEIMLNGLYTDKELQKIFKKHVEMNSESLDRNKMLAEIHHLKISLNVGDFSDDEDEESIFERFRGLGKFAQFSPSKPPTPPKILDENKIVEKLRNHEESWLFEESRRKSKSSESGKNSVVLVDANPKIFVTERDVLLTLMEMKLEPGQVRTICKRLQSKSSVETSLSQTTDEAALGEVPVDPSSSRRKGDRGNSSIIKRKVERSKFESYVSPDLSRFSTIGTRRGETTGIHDGTTQAAIVEDAKKSKTCEFHYDGENATFMHTIEETREPNLPKKVVESQTNEELQPEVAIQTQVDSQARGVMTSTSLDRINGVTTGSRTDSSEFQKLPELSPNQISDRDDNSINNKSPSESPRVQSLKNWQNPFPETDEEEQSVESDDKERIKNESIKKERSSTLKNQTTKAGQKVEQKPIKNESLRESPRVQSLRNRKKSFPETDEEEQSGSVESDDKEKMKNESIKKERSSSLKKRPTKVEQKPTKNQSPRESPRVSSLENRKKSFPNTDEEEQSGSAESDDKERMKNESIKKKRSSSLKKRPTKVEQKPTKNQSPRESPRVSSLENRKKSFPNTDEEEQSGSAESDDKGMMKNESIKKKRASTLNKKPTKTDQKVEQKSRPLSKLTKQPIVTVDKNDAIPKTRRRKTSTMSNKSKKSAAKISAIDNPDLTNVDSEEPKDPDPDLSIVKSPIASTTDDVETNISENSEATITYTVTEKGSHITAVHEKIDDITDKEMTSLSEELSQIEESGIPEEISPNVDLEKVEESEIPEILGKSESVLSKISTEEKFEIFDESKEAKISVTESILMNKSDEILREEAKISVTESILMKKSDEVLREDSKESEPAIVTKISSQISDHIESMNEERDGLTGASNDLLESPNDDESSISEDLAQQAAVESDNRVAESNDDVDESKTSSLELQREKESDDEDVMINEINTDKNSKKEIREEETKESRELSEKSMSTLSMSNEISEENISCKRSQDLYSPLVKENFISGESSNDRMKTTKEKSCSPCIGQLIGKSTPRNGSTSLDEPRTSVKKESLRKRTTFLDDRTTTMSDISLLRNENFDKSAQLSFENAPEVRDIQDAGTSYLHGEQKTNSLPWMVVEKNLANERQERLEVSAPRRDTIHRRTSLIRSLRIAVKNLKKRRTTGRSETRWSNFQQFSPEAQSSSDTTTLLESKENVPETIQSDLLMKESSWESSSDAKMEPKLNAGIPGTSQTNKMSKSSWENNSNAKIEPESKGNIPWTIQRDEIAKSSWESSSNAIIHPEMNQNISGTIRRNAMSISSWENDSSAKIESELQENIPDTIRRDEIAKSSRESSLNAIIHPELNHNISGTIRRNAMSKSSWENNSYAKIEPELQENIPDTIQRDKMSKSSWESSSNAVIHPELNHNISGTIRRNAMSKSSWENNSSAKIEPELEENIPDTIQRDKMSKSSWESSSNAVIHPELNHNISGTIRRNAMSKSSWENNSSAKIEPELEENIPDPIQRDEMSKSSWESSSNAVIHPELNHNISGTIRRNAMSKSSWENNSSAKIEPELEENIPDPIQRDKMSKSSWESSSNAIIHPELNQNIPGTIRKNEMSKSLWESSSNALIHAELNQNTSGTIQKGEMTKSSSESTKDATTQLKTVKNLSGTVDRDKMAKNSWKSISNATIQSDLENNIPVMIQRDGMSKSSWENNSNAKIETELKANISGTIQRDEMSKSSWESSSNTLTHAEMNPNTSRTIQKGETTKSSSESTKDATTQLETMKNLSGTVDRDKMAKNSWISSSDATIQSDLKNNIPAMIQRDGMSKSSWESRSNSTIRPELKQNHSGISQRDAIAKNSLEISSNAMMHPESKANLPETIQRAEITRISKNVSSSTRYSRSVNENSPVPSMKNKCRPDCPGLRFVSQQQYLYASPSDFCERLRSSNSSSLESINSHQDQIE